MGAKEKIKQRLPNVKHEDIDKLSDEQASFIVHPLDKSCFLSACPGSGKTQVVGIKTAYEVADWKEKYSGIAVLSFTKRAAKEIADRVAKYDGINATKHPHFIGTIDSWLHSFILHPFGHKISSFTGRNGDKSFSLIENESDADFLFIERFSITYKVPVKDKKGNVIYIGGTKTPKERDSKYNATNFTFSFKGEVETIKSNDIIPQNINLEDLKKIKKNLLEKGICTYQDAEYLCYQVLGQNENLLITISKRFPTIIIDECQDLSYSQLGLLHLLKEKGTHIHFVGDINQAIYDFRKVYTDKFIKFINHHNFEKKQLTDNYRSNQNIVDVCSKIIEKTENGKILNNAITGKEINIYQDCFLIWEYDNDIQDLPNKFITLLEERRLDVSKSAILGRSHTLLQKFRPDTNSEYKKIELFANALHCWNVSNRTGKDMQNALQQIGKSISYLAYQGKGNSQQQHCPENILEIDWRMFLYELLNNATKAKLHIFEKKTWSEWIKLLKRFLENYWDKLPNGKQEWNKIKAKIISPHGRSAEKVIEKIKSTTSNDSEKIRITTIHDVKGETFDAVLLVSAKDKNSKGGHVEQWVGLVTEAKEEHIRFAYVASSRPKHLLVWAIPKNTKNKTKIRELLGLEQAIIGTNQPIPKPISKQNKIKKNIITHNKKNVKADKHEKTLFPTSEKHHEIKELENLPITPKHLRTKRKTP